MKDDNSPITSLLNLGPKSAEWIEATGITSVGELRKLGAVETYWRVKKVGFNVSLNLLYALEGAITNTHWSKLSHDQRSRLLIEVDAREDQEKRSAE